MAILSTKRILAAAEKSMNLRPGNSQSTESTEFFIRCGLSGNTSLAFVPSDIAQMNEIFKGHYPATMTDADIDQISLINEAFDEACR